MLEDMWDEEVRGCLLYNLYGGHKREGSEGGPRGMIQFVPNYKGWSDAGRHVGWYDRRSSWNSKLKVKKDPD